MYTDQTLKKKKVRYLSPCHHTIHLKSHFYNYIRYTWLGRIVEISSANEEQGFTQQETAADKVQKQSLNPNYVIYHCRLKTHMAFNFTYIYLLQPGTQNVCFLNDTWN